MKPKRKWIWAALAAHFLVVLGGVTSTNLSRFGYAGDIVAMYGDLTGAYSGFGFFAPGVSEDLRARFLVETGTGEPKVEELYPADSNEANLRVANILNSFWDKIYDVDMRRALTASWAAKVFSRHPEATLVTVEIEAYRPVSMADFRSGEQGKWELYYRARYQR